MLKTVAAVTDETDWAGTLAVPGDSLLAEVSSGRSDGHGDLAGLECVVEWLAGTTLVAGAGSFNCQFTVVAPRHTTAGLPLATTMVAASVPIAGVGYQPIVIDFAGGDGVKFTLRLYSISPPATTDGFRVLWRER